MTKQHTPGPWRYEPGTKTIRSEPTNYWLATMDSWDGAVNHEANARLIAEAPAMLDALRALESWTRSLSEQDDANVPDQLERYRRGHVEAGEQARAILARIDGGV